jgi:chorismate lyase/3-hydroxybenzoate synthase
VKVDEMLRRGREVYHSDRAPLRSKSSVRDPHLPVRDTTQHGRAPALGTIDAIRLAYCRPAHPAFPALAVVRFGTDFDEPVDAPLCIDVGLEPLGDTTGDVEIWRAEGPVTTARVGSIRYATDGRTLVGLVEVDEREYGGLGDAAEAVYREIVAFQNHSAFPTLLRMWNYMDAINEVSGGLERYRQFCVGRARGLSSIPAESFPAASGIGRQHSTHKLQIYWLASREPARPVENPRQVSAYRYPPEHGPVSPSFSRASIAEDGTMFVSGTASIVGHASLHDGDPLAQLDETLRNLEMLTEFGQGAGIDERTLLKVYVRRREDADLIARALRERAPECPTLLLAGDICRKELLLEIEAVRTGRSAP